MAVTPNYGWPVPVATDYVKDGWEAISDLGNAIDTTVATLGSGLTLIKSQTVGSAVTSVTVSDAFSADYDAYKITYTGGTSSGIALNLQLGSTTTGYYSNYIYGRNSTNTVGNNAYANQANWANAGLVYANGGNITVELLNPYLAKWTYFASRIISDDYGGIAQGYLNNTTSYTAFTVIAASGNFTGGEIRVYGFQNS